MEKRIRLYIKGELPLHIGAFNYRTNLDFWAIGCIYQGIRMYNNDYRLTNRLLEEFYYDKKINAYYVKIKKAYWNDGKLIESKNIKYSFEQRVKNTNNNKFKFFLRNLKGIDSFINGGSKCIEGIELISNNTMLFYMVEEDYYFENAFLLPILREEISKNDKEVYEGNIDVLGCGPFIPFKVEKNKIIFKSNKNFHLGCPKIDEMIIEFGNSERKYEMLNNCKVDFAQIQKKELDECSNLNDNYDIYYLDTLSTTDIMINNNKEIFKCIKNRKVLKDFIDLIKDNLINNIYGETAVAINGFYPPTVCKSLDVKYNYEEKNSYDKEMLKNLTGLTIGYKKGDLANKEIAEYISKKLSEFIKITVKEYENMKEAFALNADLFVNSLLHQIMPFSNSYFDVYRDNFISEDYKCLLKLYDSLKRAGINKEDIESFVVEVEKCIPIIPLLSIKDIQIIRKGFTGLKPDGRGILWNIHEIDFV